MANPFDTHQLFTGLSPGFMSGFASMLHTAASTPARPPSPFCSLCGAPCLDGEGDGWLHRYERLEGRMPLVGACAVLIHTYCADIARVLWQGNVPSDVALWTGRGPWSKPPADTQGEEDVGKDEEDEEKEDEEESDSIWEGSAVQRGVHASRRRATTSSSDLNDPTNIGNPVAESFSVDGRPEQTSKLLILPGHILANIAHHVLAPGDGDWEWEALQPLRGTCAALRSLPLPGPMFCALATREVNKFMADVLKSWNHINMPQLTAALTDAFRHPLVNAFMDIATSKNETDGGMDHSHHEGDEGNPGNANAQYSAADVYMWWRYTDGWRARRRAWTLAVAGCEHALEHAEW